MVNWDLNILHSPALLVLPWNQFVEKRHFLCKSGRSCHLMWNLSNLATEVAPKSLQPSVLHMLFEFLKELTSSGPFGRILLKTFLSHSKQKCKWCLFWLFKFDWSSFDCTSHTSFGSFSMQHFIDHNSKGPHYKKKWMNIHNILLTVSKSWIIISTVIFLFTYWRKIIIANFDPIPSGARNSKVPTIWVWAFGIKVLVTLDTPKSARWTLWTLSTPVK